MSRPHSRTEDELNAGVALPPELEAALAQGLAQPPEVEIPADFATRVAKMAARQPARSPARLGWGPRLALGSAALLTLALFVLAPHATPSLSDLRFDGELLLLAELGGLLLFFGRLFFQE